MVAICVAVGVGTLVQRSAQVFMALKLAGALYLIWLGSRRSGGAARWPRRSPRPPQARSDRRAVREGFVVGVTNPKALILFGAVLPQFVNRAAGHVPLQMLLLSLVSIVIGLVSDTTWGLAASRLRSWFARSPRRFALVGGAGGLAMIGVGSHRGPHRPKELSCVPAAPAPIPGIGRGWWCGCGCRGWSR